MTHTIPEGTSEPQDFQLSNDDVAFVGTGFDVELEIYRERPGRAPQALGSPAPTVAWLDQAAGTVRATGCEYLTVGTYLVRYKVTAEDAAEGFFPNGQHADVWRVVPVPAL